MKRICELMVGDIFYRGINRCKVSEIREGVMYYAMWSDTVFTRDRRWTYRAASKEKVIVPDRETVGGN